MAQCKQNAFRSLRNAALSVLLAVLSVQAPADDTDIYLSPQASAAGTPLVMISLDWRPNLGSTVCQGGVCQDLIDEGFLVPDNPNQISFFELLKATLKKVLDPLAKVKVGLMMNHDSQKNCDGPDETGCSNGGYMLAGFKDTGDQAQLSDFYAALDAIPLPHGNESHKYQGRELFFELFRFLTGQGVHNAHNGWRNFGTKSNRNIDDPLDTPPDSVAELSWDQAIESAGNYLSPLPAVPSCSKIFTINVMFQVSQQDDSADGAIAASKADGGMELDNGDFTEMIEYLNDVDLADGSFNPDLDIPGKQNVISYFITPNSNTTTDGYANAGGTGSALTLSEDPEELYKLFNSVFSEILSISTTLVSASVPVNVFNRAQALDDVFISLFQANANYEPQWVGNLKKLKVGEDGSGNKRLEDANSDAAIDFDGRIKHSALTLWTLPGDLPDPGDDDEFQIGKDGRTVDRGGAGGVCPGFRPVPGNSPGTANPTGTPTPTTARRVFTEPDSYTNGTPADLRAFEADQTTAQALLTTSNYADALFEAVMDCTGCSYDTASGGDKNQAKDEVEELVKFARGIDTEDQDGDGSTSDVRPWSFGDALHWRPIPINYGALGSYTEDNPDVRVVVGANDGFVRMFQGADNSGVEQWAFAPRLVIPEMVRLKHNNSGTPLHPYLVDGEPALLTIDTNDDHTLNHDDGDQVLLYFGLRRSGKHYYALDLSNPDDPRMLWSIGNSNTDFTELGQTWSRPRVGRILVDADDNASTSSDVTSHYVLVFGAGYNGDDGGDGSGDLGKDERDENGSFVGGNDDEGNAVFVVDALTGELLWKAVKTAVNESTGPVNGQPQLYKHTDLHDAIPATAALLDTDADTYADRFYVGDTGGVVWRGDLSGPIRSDWTLTPILSVGRHFSNTNAADRRFFHRVDFVPTQDESGEFDAIVIGSGDRPYPLGEKVENYIYMYKDWNTLSGDPPGSLATHDDLADLTDNCLDDDDFTDCTDGDAESKLATGWRVKLENCAAGNTGTCGEKSLASPLTIHGTIFFTTYLPPDADNLNSCQPSEGTGLFYAMSLHETTPVINFDLTNDTNGVTLERFEKLKTGGIPSQLVPIGDQRIIRSDLQIEDVGGNSGAKTYWYERYYR